jgi:enoyl-CoA hydratase/carnithine racemase
VTESKQLGEQVMTTKTEACVNELLYEAENGIGTLTLNRPHRRNALTFAMYDKIKQICARAGTNNDPDKLRVIIFKGAGDAAFAAGTDISQFKSFSGGDDAIAYEQMIEAVLHEIEHCKVPTIAALNGFVTGGGAAIAASCSLRIGSQSVKVGVPIAKTLGNCLAVANLKRFIALIGEARTAHILLTAQLIDAENAKLAGFITELLEDQSQLEARAMELATSVTQSAPLTVKATLTGIRRLREATPLPDDHDLITMCFGSNDFKEGVTAFFEKRRAEWTGK